jgi:ribosomal protein S20
VPNPKGHKTIHLKDGDISNFNYLNLGWGPSSAKKEMLKQENEKHRNKQHRTREEQIEHIREQIRFMEKEIEYLKEERIEAFVYNEVYPTIKKMIDAAYGMNTGNIKKERLSWFLTETLIDRIRRGIPCYYNNIRYLKTTAKKFFAQELSLKTVSLNEAINCKNKAI